MGGREGEAPERGLVAVSEIRTLSRAFDRMEMSVRRSRRAGGMSAALGALTLRLLRPEVVGKRTQEEVTLLAPHTQVVAGGINARCLASGWNFCHHPTLYLHPMEVPPVVGLDSFVQAAYHTAVTTNGLVAPGEKLLCLAFGVESSFPYCPLEAELPYTVVQSRPLVYPPGQEIPEGTGMGTPVLGGAPIQFYRGSLLVGFSQYVEHQEEVPAERAMHWWSQKRETPFYIHMFFTREAHADALHLTNDTHVNPFDEQSPESSPNALQRSKQRLRQAVWRRVEEFGEDPWGDSDKEYVQLPGEPVQDTEPFLAMGSSVRKPPEGEGSGVPGIGTMDTEQGAVGLTTEESARGVEAAVVTLETALLEGGEGSAVKRLEGGTGLENKEDRKGEDLS